MNIDSDLAGFRVVVAAHDPPPVVDVHPSHGRRVPPPLGQDRRGAAPHVVRPVQLVAVYGAPEMKDKWSLKDGVTFHVIVRK